MEFIPRGATKSSPTISNEAIADRLAVLKATLSDIATSWYDRERRSTS
ncbi:MAG: hypothetical protein FWF36_02445 [Propionibacteriaceae bacterium]|nr:hypothetical protein [Propionibacteriaceae bacterium]